MMNSYNSDFKKILLIAVFAALIIFILIYGYFKLRHIIVGPYISDINIENTTRTEDDYLNITGTAKNVEEIRMNGKPIFTTEEGIFNEDIILLPGYNIIVFDLVDRIGKERKYEFPIVLDQEMPTIPEETNDEIIEE